MKETIRERLTECGAVAVGFAGAGEIDGEAARDFEDWLLGANHGGMSYLESHAPLRRNTDNVLRGAKTVISLAFDYTPSEERGSGLPYISCYAYGMDYHKVLRSRLYPAIDELKSLYGGEWRICIDSAPVAERYWAVKSGIGFKGNNGVVIVPGAGCFCFLVEILVSLEITPDRASEGHCEGCGACFRVCPSGALNEKGEFDAGKCINYLTIEKKGNFDREEEEILKKGAGFLFGCDLCMKVCPHNRCNHERRIAEFSLQPVISNLSPEDILTLTSSGFKKKFEGSPLQYAGYERLSRNARLFEKDS